MRMLAYGLALSIATCAGSWVTGIAQAQTVKHILKGSYITDGNNDLGVNSPGAFLDTPTAISCPGTKPCTVEAEQFATLGEKPETPGGQYGLCFYIDGAVIPKGCFFSGTWSFTSLRQSVSNIQSSQVSPGLHTVQTLLATDGFVFAMTFHTTYRLYQP